MLSTTVVPDAEERDQLADAMEDARRVSDPNPAPRCPVCRAVLVPVCTPRGPVFRCNCPGD